VESDFYARYAANGARQRLAEHLKGVADLAKGFAIAAVPANAAFAEAASLAGLLHDLGKYRDEFQTYLKAGDRAQRTTETAHSVYGAAAACFRFNSEAIAFAIAGHHSGLHDEEHLARLISGSKFKADARFPGLIHRAEPTAQIGALPSPPMIEVDDTPEGRRRYEFLTRILFSLLVDADRLNSEKWEKDQALGQPWTRRAMEFHAECLLQRLQAAREERATGHAPDSLNKLRNDIFDACLNRGKESPQGFFALTVPTGGGKTLSSMAFALSHAKCHNLRRVIVVIPFLSIIEQNARDYRQIFGAGQVLEHHSAIERPESARPSDTDLIEEPYQATDADRAMENWDAPVIVTTSVQFIETLFAAATSRARKLHNIARSVVVFDEVQTLPTHLLEPTLDVLRELKHRYAVSFLFCSATQPAFKKSASLKRGFEPGELSEIAPNPATIYQNLQRVSYRIESVDERWDWKRIADRIIAHDQALCVLNLRRQAFETWQAVRQRLQEEGRDDLKNGVFHLSSAMCPAHRLDVLGLSTTPPANNVNARLKAKKHCWVISTQLIEAGVDIDFPLVLRAMGPLDSIVQAGGRCNREGLLKDHAGKPCLGQVIVFYPEDNGLPPGIYAKATLITPNYLVTENLATDPDIFSNYFNELYQVTPTDHVRRGEHTIQQDRSEFNFRKVAERAKVIKDDTVSVIVPYGRAKQLIKSIKEDGPFDRDMHMLRRFQRYTVSLRRGPHSDLAKLEQVAALQPLLPGRLEIPVLSERCYDQHRGVVIENRAPDEFII
jgi:CRISPR-associated endonuclease/helicase Cas3